MNKIKATLISEKVTSNTAEAQSLFATSRFGERLGEKILYSLSEALFLVQDKKIIKAIPTELIQALQQDKQVIISSNLLRG